MQNKRRRALAERYLNRILDENYEVMIYDGEIGERLLEILGAALM